MIIECPACTLRYDTGAHAAGERLRCRCGQTLEVPAAPIGATALNCPQCGGAPEQGASRCGYCGTALALTKCPRCFGALFRGAKHCPHCGVRASEGAREVREADAPGSPCPRCGDPRRLSPRTVGGILLDECGACGGVFVDRAALERAVADRDKQAALAGAGPRDPGPATSTPAEAKVVYLRCPECTTLMTRTNFGRISGVIVDVCRAHGTWFDRDELQRVAEFVMAGGLERSRQRQIADLEREIAAKKQMLKMGPVERGTGLGDMRWGQREDRFAGLDLLSLADDFLGLFR